MRPARLTNRQSTRRCLKPNAGSVSSDRSSRLSAAGRRRLRLPSANSSQPFVRGSTAGDNAVGVEDEITAATAYSPTKTSIDIAGFVTALDHYIKEFPDDPRSVAFKKTKEEQPLWKALQAWNAASGLWKPGDTAQMTAQEAKLRGDLCGKFLAQYSGFPSAAEILMYQKYLEAIARRASSDESPASKIRSLFTDILVDHVWMVTTKDDAEASSKSIVKRYYATKKPIEDGNFVRFNCIISFEGTEKARTILKDRVAYLGLSPQSKIAERFGPDLADESKLAQWESLMRDLVEAIRRVPDIDPILQVVLLRKVVESAIEGSEPLRASFESLKARLDAGNVDANVPWMNPDVPQVGGERASQVAQNLGGALESRKQVLARANEIETNAGCAPTGPPAGSHTSATAGNSARASSCRLPVSCM